MDFFLWMMKLGIPYYRTAIFTYIDTNNQLNIPLPKQMPTDIGRIFGLSIYADTVDPANNPLITTTQAQNLYLTFKDGATEFFTPVRLDDLLFNFAGVPTPGGQKFLPVNEPGKFDLSTSFFVNPTGIVSAAPPALPICIQLNLWYINDQTYKRLLTKGEVLQNALTQSELQGVHQVNIKR